MNVNLLKAQIALKGKKISEVSETLKISKSAFYRKLNGKSDFTRQEICDLINYLGIDTEKAMEIFFYQKVS
ncbi:helix-turn-helix domain-containing protein [Clostridium beijerinckii]|uniref:Plasmid maintenance system antidote protein VapI n=1 Tax=Clostridium beijerinckii TaxID=1520 RepID=A0AAE5H9H7_CLOBE|nr:helix-turn-helix transcriptional regulator [Clostridium beijerinckii]NSB16492.1 plasmid maintenance system antidote protein VapI [Clostridium beijerinckii]OOM25697.1 helix-turn-helix domain protein [Clostridium beijerinckii]